MRNALQTLNAISTEGTVASYTIAGGMALSLHMEPHSIEGLEILVRLPKGETDPPKLQALHTAAIAQGGHINGIESFWAYAKLRLAKMKGIQRHMFYLHLKETKFRFNQRRDNLYQILIKLLREQPI